MTGPLAVEHLAGLGDWIRGSAPRSSLPFRFVSSAPTPALRELLAADLSAATDGLFAHHELDSIAALARIQPQPWESEVLSAPAFSLNAWLFADPCELSPAALDALIQGALHSVRHPGESVLVAAKCWASDIPLVHALERNGFLLMDTAVDVLYDPIVGKRTESVSTPLPDGLALRLAGPEDSAALRALAGLAFARHFGRFHSDPRIGRERATVVYQEWICACLDGWADFVFVVEDLATKELAGFSAWKRPSARAQSLQLPLGHYSIGAVSPAFSGRGLFKNLTLAGTKALGENLAVEGPTHLHNLAVQRGYLSLGWKIADSRHTFHAWLE